MNLFGNKFGLRAAIALTMAAVSAPAAAEPILLSGSDIGNSFTVNFNGFTGDGTVAGLLGSAIFTLTKVTSNSYAFSYVVKNISVDPIDTSRISGFGFNTNPEISGASSTGTFTKTATSGNVPNVGTVDVCFKAGGGGNSCAGGGGGGVNLGQTGSGTLTLNFASPLTSLALDDFFVRYQSITGAGSVSSAVGTGTVVTTTSGGTTSGGTTTGGTQVPEPGVVGLFALGVLGLGLAMGRRNRRGNAQA